MVHPCPCPPDGVESLSATGTPPHLWRPQRPRRENTKKAPRSVPPQTSLSSGAHAPQLGAGRAGKRLASYWRLARKPAGPKRRGHKALILWALGDVTEPPEGPNGAVGGGARRAVGANPGAECLRTARGWSPRECSCAACNTLRGQHVGGSGGSKAGKAGLGRPRWCGRRQAAAEGEHGASAGWGQTRYGAHLHPLLSPSRSPPRPFSRDPKLEWASSLSLPEDLALESGGTALPSPRALERPEGALGQCGSGRDP